MKNHIFFLFTLIGVTAAQNGPAKVDFYGRSFTVSCGEHGEIMPSPPDAELEEKYTWKAVPFKDKEPIDKYSCVYSNGLPYKIYIQAQGCENCYELDGALVVGVICGDLLITGGIILIVFLHGQRKSGPAPQKTSNARRPAGSSGGPQVPSPDYQPLSDFTRSKDTYATVHKTG